LRVEIVKAKPEHIPYIAANIREADRQEIFDMSLMKPQEALEKSLQMSLLCWTGLVNGIPVCMFGVSEASMLFKMGRPWLIGTNDIDKCAMVFLRRNKRMIKAMLDCFDRLENYVEETNTRSIEWLKWLNFKFDEQPQPMGLFKKPFYRFYMENA
jgi:hypothetical protein